MTPPTLKPLIRVLFIFALGQLILGCQTYLNKPPKVMNGHNIDNLNQYHFWLTEQTTVELNKELQRLSVLESSDNRNRAKLFLLNSLPKSATYNPKTAIRIYPRLNGAFSLAEQQLLTQIHEQLQLKLDLQAVINKSTKTKTQLNQKVQQQKAQLENLQAENELLKQQIQQLKQIENSIDINGQ